MPDDVVSIMLGKQQETPQSKTAAEIMLGSAPVVTPPLEVKKEPGLISRTLNAVGNIGTTVLENVSGRGLLGKIELKPPSTSTFGVPVPGLPKPVETAEWPKVEKAKTGSVDGVINSFLENFGQHLIDTPVISMKQYPVAPPTNAAETAAGAVGTLMGEVPELVWTLGGINTVIKHLMFTLPKAAAPIVADAIRAGFTMDTLRNAFNSSKELIAGLKEGDLAKVRDASSSTFLDVVFAYLLSKGYVKDATDLRAAYIAEKAGIKAPPMESSAGLQKEADVPEVKKEVKTTNAATSKQKTKVKEAKVKKPAVKKETKVPEVKEPVKTAAEVMLTPEVKVSEPTPEEIKVLDKVNPNWDELPNEEIGKLVDQIRAGKIPEAKEAVLEPEPSVEETAKEIEEFGPPDKVPIVEPEAPLANLSVDELIAKLKEKKKFQEQDVMETIDEMVPDKVESPAPEPMKLDEPDVIMEPAFEEGSPFRAEADVTKAQANNYARSKIVASNMMELKDPNTDKSPLVTMHKLVNDVNRWLDGSEVDIEGTRNFLSEIAARGKELGFDDEDMQFAQDAAKWAKGTDRSKIKGSSTLTSLHFGVDPKEVLSKGKEVIDYFKKATAAKSFKPGEAAQLASQSLMRDFLDPSGNIKQWLVKAFGDEGYRVVTRMITSKGGGSRSQMMFNQADAEIFSGLSKAEKEMVRKYNLMDRLVAISKTEKGKTFQYPEGISLENAQNYVDNIATIEGISFEQAQRIKARSQVASDWMRKVATDMYDAGLIGEQELKDLTTYNYRRIQSIESLYDKENPSLSKKFGRTVNDSGVQTLRTTNEKGKVTLLDPSLEAMMLETFNRSYGRIMNNEANAALVELAKSHPDNPWARIVEKDTRPLTEQPTDRKKLINSINIKRGTSTLSDYEFRSKVKELFKTRSIKKLTNEQLAQLDKELGPVSMEYVPAKRGTEPRIPKGWSRVYYYENGQRKTIHLAPEFAREWVISSPEMTNKMSRILGWALGTPILRTFATGINWAFAIRNMPRDILHALTTSRYYRDGKWRSTYSPYIPIASGQITADYTEVFNDVIFRRGEYKDAMNEGLGMDWLAVQGRLFHQGSHVGGPFDKIVEVLEYPGSTSELLTRLAIRRRIIKNRAAEAGISYDEMYKNKEVTKEATAMARDFMDYAQSGGVTRALNNVIPYFSATLQATRGLVRSFSKDTTLVTTYKMGQFVALATTAYLVGYWLNEKAMKDLSGDQNAVNSLTIPLPEEYSYTENGQKVHQYIKLPLDSFQKFLKAVTDASLDVMNNREPDIQRINNAALALTPVGTSSLPPALNALIGYKWNKDTFTNSDVWRGEGGTLPYPLSANEYVPGRTPQGMVDIGQVTGLSPDRLQHVLESYFTSNSDAAALIGTGYSLLKGLPASQREKVLAEVLQQIPEARSILGVTRPYSKFAEMITTEKDLDRAKRLHENNGLDTHVNSYLKDKTETKGDVLRYIAQEKDKDVRERLTDRFKFAEGTATLPNRSFWLSLRGTPTEVRAAIYLDRLSQSSPEEKAALYKEEAYVKRVENRLKSAQFSIFTDEFKKAIRKVNIERNRPK